MTEIIDLKNIEKCIEAMKKGDPIIIPTETVYGIGALAFDVQSVEKVYELKKRDKKKSLIVLVDSMEMLNRIVKKVTYVEEKLIKAFWPGPLTIIFESNGSLPSNVTGGKDTIAVRIPDNAIDLELIHRLNQPITAPSANISGKLSITEAMTAYQEFNGKVPYILDGGKSSIGLESTIVKVKKDIVSVLRIGKILPEDIEKLGLKVEIIKDEMEKKTHYQMDKKVILISGTLEEQYHKMKEYIENDKNETIDIIGFKENHILLRESVHQYMDVGYVEEVENFSKNLFQMLYTCDKSKADTILIELPEEKGFGGIVIDKLKEVTNHDIL